MDNTDYSARSISILLGTEDEILLHGQFLDSFYRKKNDNDRYQLLKDEPVYNPNYRLFLCMLAGSVEKLANDCNLPVPEWTKKQDYKFGHIYFAYNTENKDYQTFLIQTTPVEYKKRNLMVGDTVLRRC